MSRSRKKWVVAALLAAALVGVIALILWRDSSRVYPRRNPVGETFPSVLGESLEQQPTQLPESLAGDPAVILVGYLQETQFDIDRWLLGLLQTEVPMKLLEVPTIPGLLPSTASDWIDNGMRSGIPKDDWGSVVTLYGDAARPVAEFTGTERGRNTRVLVLDGNGKVVWFNDEGYSARYAIEIAQLVQSLQE